MRALVVFPYPPSEVRVRSMQILSDLASFSDVDLVYLDDGGPFQGAENIANVWRVNNRSSASRFFRLLLGSALGRPFTYYWYYSSRAERLLATLLSKDHDFLFAERLPLSRRLTSRTRFVFDCVDCFGVQTNYLARFTSGPRSIGYAFDKLVTPRFETRLCNQADLVLTTVDRERTHLIKQGVTVPISAYFHGVKAGFFEFSADVPDGPPSKRLCFHGKLSYAANDLALSKLNDIQGSLVEAGYQTQIFGKVAPGMKEKFRHLSFHGYADSLPKQLSRCSLAVFPLPVSVGVPNKVIEAMAVGLPVVATPAVFDGLPDAETVSGQGLFIADITDFPAVIRGFFSLPSSQRRRMSVAVRQYAERISCPEVRRDRLRQLLQPGP